MAIGVGLQEENHKLKTAIFIVGAIFCCGLVVADEEIWQFELWQGPSVPVRMYVPKDSSRDSAIVIVMHGNSRDAKRYFRDWRTLADERSLIVVVPEFTKRRFAGSARYNLGHVFHPDTGKQLPEDTWTFSAIEPLFDEVVSRVGGKQTHYSLYGHSAGAQFVHRFMYYKPTARVTTFIAANAGWYTLPVSEFDYPYGLNESKISVDDLASIFSRNLVILLGREDTDQNAKSLRHTPEAEKQGPHRLARGLTMYRVAKARAGELGLDFNWKLFTVKGADHDNAKMAPAAAAFVGHEVAEKNR